ncbi:Mitochondrial import inner membrane translocase subunit TIM22-3 [Hibiscus syriacus]|uniref:Mitochondrial import inner membrane translocase subunit TIM22-3 n=1 Tax=Hibiscus syriacus TaxID=106335 RepID=A0A6A2WKD2_HIBSY|nr:Mitochondrial import inner membrane translocase subunit TIM22-3 [Hibiscus syriacus]
MATLDSSNPSTETDVETNPTPDPNSSKATIPNPPNSNSPAVCLINFAGDSAAGAFMGSIFGFGSGLIKKKGFKGSFVEAGSYAKFCRVYTVWCLFLKRLRGKDDVINAGVAGCCTGLALSFQVRESRGSFYCLKGSIRTLFLDRNGYAGAPQALLQSCLTFGAFSLIMEGLNKQQPALAHSFSARKESGTRPALPLPDELKGAFSSFCKTLVEPNKGSSWTAN